MNSPVNPQPRRPHAPRIAIVDDVSDIRFLLRAALERTGRFAVVAEGCDGVEAIAIAKLDNPDLMILNVRMPRMNGVAALPAIRALAPSCRVVMLSADDSARTAQQAMAAGAARYEVMTAGMRVVDIVEDVLGLVA